MAHPRTRGKVSSQTVTSIKLFGMEVSHVMDSINNVEKLRCFGNETLVLVNGFSFSYHLISSLEFKIISKLKIAVFVPDTYMAIEIHFVENSLIWMA